MSEMKDKILVYVRANPSKTAKQVARALGVKTTYVYNVKSTAGLTKPKSQPINGAMKDAIGKALAEEAKPMVEQNSKLSMSIQVHIQTSTREFNMTMAEAKEMYEMFRQFNWG